jgi:DNA-binding protein Fis
MLNQKSNHRTSIFVFVNFVSLSLISFNLASCGVVIGTQKPSDQKDSLYSILDLSKTYPDWQKLDATLAAGILDKDFDRETFSSEIPDRVYQHQTSGSILSINSACNKKFEQQPLEDSLQQITNLLTQNLENTKVSYKKDIVLEHSPHPLPALETQMVGNDSQSHTPMITTVTVLKLHYCQYDIILIQPNTQMKAAALAAENEQYLKFRNSLRLRESL